MQMLPSWRNTRHMARYMLVWFGFFVGASIASPLVQPQGMQLVCSASGGSKLIVDETDSATGMLIHSMECPLCLIGGAPPPPASRAVSSAPAMAHFTLPALELVRSVRLAAAPLPARGPPLVS